MESRHCALCTCQNNSQSLRRIFPGESVINRMSFGVEQGKGSLPINQRLELIEVAPSDLSSRGLRAARGKVGHKLVGDHFPEERFKLFNVDVLDQK